MNTAAEQEQSAGDLSLRRIRTGRKFVPFAWQEKAALKHIRKNCEDYGSTLAVYCALTVVASDEQSDEFQTTHQWLAMQSGFSVRTVQSRLHELESLGLVAISTPKLKCPSSYRLLPFGNGCRTFGNGEGFEIADIRSKSLKNKSEENPKTAARFSARLSEGNSPAENSTACSGVPRENSAAPCAAPVAHRRRFPGSVELVYEFADENGIAGDKVERWLRYNETNSLSTGVWPITKSWRSSLREFAATCDKTHGAGPVPDGWVPDEEFWWTTSGETVL